MKLDLHIHTDHSYDCQSKVRDVVKAAEQAGLDAIAITDHDNMSAYGLARKITDSLIVIPAMEITSDQGTHIIGLFLNNEIVSRDCFEIIEEIHSQGGLVLIPHPFHKSTGLLSNRFHDKIYDGVEFEKILGQVDLFESFTYGSDAEDIVDTNKFLSVHSEVPVCAGSDAHSVDDIGKAYIEFQNDSINNLDGIKKALLKSSRLLRYEAFSAEKNRVVSGEMHLPGKTGFFRKFTNSTVLPVMNSIRNLYSRPDKEEGEGGQ